MARTPPVRTATPKVWSEPRSRRRQPPSVEVLGSTRDALAPQQDGTVRPLAYLASLLLYPLQHRFGRVTVEAHWRSHDLAAGSTLQIGDARPTDVQDQVDAGAERAAAIDRNWAVATMVVAASLALAVSVIIAPRLREANEPAYSPSSAMLQQGAAVYAASCAGCHGADLKGGVNAQGFGPPPLDAGGHAWLHSDVTLFRMVKFGIQNCQPDSTREQMPSFNGQLDDPSIRAVVAFIKSRWPAGLRSVQDAFNDGESDTAETQEAVLCTAICQPPSSIATGR
jgi:mono/diheme cytochrome c family protein